MDTSKEYIEICRMATKIQEQSPTTDDFTRRPISISKEGNWFYIQVTGKIGYKSIWLPRQDQLQDMFQKYESEHDQYGQGVNLWGLCTKIKDFAGSDIIQQKNKSMEQLWLAFVMHEKFNKVWTHNKTWESI